MNCLFLKLRATKNGMPRFTPEELKLLEKYVTNPEGDVFCVKNMQGLTGAAYARYSRAKGGFREVLLKEFLKEGMVDPKHAEDLIARILIAFGDDSVGELEGVHVSFEEVSNLATKIIEDRRIGGSPIEQSSRYVVYDQRDEEGRYRYLREPKIMASKWAKEYEDTLDHIFETYTSLIPKMKTYLGTVKPVEEAEYDLRGDREKLRFKHCKDEKEEKAFKLTYNTDLKTKTCDALRCLLPVATLTNIGMFGNGRFYQYLLSNLYSTDLAECKSIAERAHKELNKLIEPYVRRAKRNEYVVENRIAMQKLTDELLLDITPRAEEDVALLDNPTNEDEYRDQILVQMLYAFSNHPISQLREFIKSADDATKKRIKETYIGERKTRRDRPGRALEFGYPLTFDIVMDFGSYRDIQRHRMCTQERQRITPDLGFWMPPEVVAAGLAEDIIRCRDMSGQLYTKIAVDMPEEAQYVALFGHNIRFTMGMNDREAMHLLELRSTPQGHQTYRDLCKKMHSKILERSPWRAEMMQFVDHNDYFWARGDAEARQRVKERKLDEKIASKTKSF